MGNVKDVTTLIDNKLGISLYVSETLFLKRQARMYNVAYLASIHRPSSVRHALKLNFLSAQDDTLVLAKANRLEFYAQQQDGLVLQHSKAIYGKVIMLQSMAGQDICQIEESRWNLWAVWNSSATREI
ncbi:hypothetical protein KCU78_g6201, partial [Aureobasidium melanogenum]